MEEKLYSSNLENANCLSNYTLGQVGSFFIFSNLILISFTAREVFLAWELSCIVFPFHL